MHEQQCSAFFVRHLRTRRAKMDKDNPRSVVEKLIETCRDGENGYRDAAEHVKSPQLKQFFQEQSRERSSFAVELESLLVRLGETGKKESGSAAAAMHRAWIDLKSNLGGGDKAILSSVEQGEDNAKETYTEALSSSLPANVASVVQRQAHSIKAGHDRVKSLRDSQAA
jgi:uncharacterized protein (TIGR02284 family)